MTSVLAMIVLIIPAFLLYSPKVEQSRVVTIAKPLVITQERRTPAYYLYQQVKSFEKGVEKPAAVTPEVTTYLSSQNYIPNEPAVTISELKVNRREMASDRDAGFTTGAAPVIATQLAARPSEEKIVLAPPASAAVEALTFNQQPEPQPLSPAKKWATVRGKFETRGIGVIDQIIELKRIEEGQIREIGRVDLKAGLYSIDIESPQGLLVAEIRARNGVLLGQDQQKIINLSNKGQYVEGPFIQVQPRSGLGAAPIIPPGSGSAGAAAIASAGGRALASASARKSSSNPEKPSALANAKSAAAQITTTLFSNQNVLDEPTEEYANVAWPSSTVAYVNDQTKRYRKVVTIRQTGDKTETPLFTEKWVQGLLEYISDQQKIEFKSDQVSILMGRLMIDGKPAAGAQIQIENHPGVNPVYLDQFMIPDSRQTETSDNGYFMFVGLENANYTVSAFRQNQIIGHQMFFAEQGALSFQTIHSTSIAQSVVARSFDAFTSDPVDIDLTTPDLEEIITTVRGSASYRRHSQLGVTEFIARSENQDYLPLRYFQDARKDFVHIPMIQEAWLKQIQTQRLINELPDTSTFIGFVPDFEYDVFLVYEGYSKDQVVYFDPQGRVSPVAVKGGGFILFNVPKDAREIVVQQDQTDRIYSQVFNSQAGQVGVAHFTE